jgi:hypothetical protein
MLRMRHARARVPAIFYLYLAAVLAMALVVVSRIGHI